MSGRSGSRAAFARARFTPEQIAQAIGQHSPTEEQRAVITAPAGPVLVVAGAGAGKTETMAGRVVWLVTNGFVSPEEILGLTFTRKAAQQLGQRIRARLARIAGSSLLRDADPAGELRTRLEIAEPDVSTYHAYAGRLLSEHGLRLPIEPSATLLGQTELWQLAFKVVNTWDGPLDIEHTPATITDSVLALSGALDEHLIDIEELEDHPHEFEDLIATLPPGPRQRAEPAQGLVKPALVQQHRRQLIPLVRRLRDALRAEGALDFGSQMSLAARVAARHPEVGVIERSRYRVVLLDEYQDTGHAQRVLLSSLYGGGQDRGLAVTAVGDPIQSIYGWRGASAANLPRFATDFPGPRGKPATRLELLTSWRNPVRALAIANSVSNPLRARGIPVSILKPRPGAPEGDIRLALCADVEAERAWVADHISVIYQHALDRGEAPPTAAVLIRRNRDAAPLAEALRERGLPVEVVGLGGLLDTPEVQDLVAMLRLVADPMAGTAAMRVLTGARWQLGASDITTLWWRARQLALTQRTGSSGAVTSSEDLDEALGEAIPGELAEHAAISDAIADPGDRANYSTEGHRRITALAGELAQLRGRLGQPLTELVADVERTIGIGIEAESRCATSIDGGTAGREHLDAFADVVAGYSRNPAATLGGLLGYLQAAATIEKGLAPGEIQVAPDRVQILTMHSAKGLEWEVVAIPHLCKGVFPSDSRSETWLSSMRELPSHLRGDRAEPGEEGAEGVPVLDTSTATNRAQLKDSLDAHTEAFARRGLDEERRLFYVAVTRTERVVLLSGHHWAEQGLKPKGPSLFLEEAKALAEGELAGTITIEHWAAKPDEAESNPLSEQVHAATWPRDALGAQRGAVEAGAKLVRAAMRQAKHEADEQPDEEQAAQATWVDADDTGTTDDAEAQRWAEDVDALLREREQRRETIVEVRLPRHLSVSNVVMLAGSPEELAVRLRRPLPYPPNPLARRGTAFHSWLERRYSATRLLDLDDLPGAADIDEKVDDNLEQLQDAFERSRWAARNPVEVEVPFETVVGNTVLRGRIDAVFRDEDGGWTVVDWKTGKEAGPRDERAVAMQLAAYRIAWADLMSTTGHPIELAMVRAAFHYVRSGNTVAPQDLPDREQLRAILENPGNTAAASQVDPADAALDH
ncbi:ATP-dependent helicase [Lolliginicoccus levis]|uniref:ATP-dependent helicase n=1 Tax=Lolliginicoccus levis TaxID=2919542 RepID=UPI00241CB65F|nr:ATP-dependent DNA helicase [Lolliginicoccus levis]